MKITVRFYMATVRT